MEWLALEAGDAATWGSTVVTFGMACYAIAQGRSQRRDLRRQNELQAEASQLQRRQIETAERRTLIMEDLLHRVSAASWPAAGAPSGTPAPSVPAREPAYFPQGAPPPPPPPAADEDVAEADVAEQAEPGPTPRPAPAAPPGGYGYPQAPPPGPVPAGPVPAGPVPAGPVSTGPVPAGDAGYGDPAPGAPRPPAPTSPPPWVPPQQAAPTGIWRVERVGRHGFALRNTGATTLTGVRVGRANLPSSARGVPEDAVVRPGETTEFLMAAERGQPLPATLAVSWHGRPGGEHVPVPPG